MGLYEFKIRNARMILALRPPLKWLYWTQPRIRLFRRQMAAARYFSRIQAAYMPIEREESDYAR